MLVTLRNCWRIASDCQSQVRSQTFPAEIAVKSQGIQGIFGVAVMFFWVVIAIASDLRFEVGSLRLLTIIFKASYSLFKTHNHRGRNYNTVNSKPILQCKNKWHHRQIKSKQLCNVIRYPHGLLFNDGNNCITEKRIRNQFCNAKHYCTIGDFLLFRNDEVM